MSTKPPYDIAVLIGRFQPFHLGHAALLAKALESAPIVVVALGSAFRARSAKNPFSWQERADMITATLPPEIRGRLRFAPIRDLYDNQRWASAVTRAVQGFAVQGDRIALVGHQKDASGYYLDLFPAWGFVQGGWQGDFEATGLRRLCYEGGPESLEATLASLPEGLHPHLRQWVAGASFAAMREEHLAIQATRRKYGLGPFVTLDALLLCAGHVLLIRRGGHPGKGLWALPGGFLELWERLEEGALRELQEETGLELRSYPQGFSLDRVAVFDHPERSQRGRTITHAHLFRLGGETCPAVCGADDAAEAHWIPLSALRDMEEQFFEDHFHILDSFLDLLGEPA
nr:bifunctional nicotinamide-nucleotide adenylyltransferase/Nudix hydroxylase [uncultured Holophaga sp.]